MSIKRSSGTFVAGTILIVLGLLSLAGQLFRNFHFWSYLWPLIIIGLGGLFFVAMLAGGKSFAGLAIPGTIISGLGVMMFLQNLTGYWESWAYSWTILIILVGLGIFIMGIFTQDSQRRQAGMHVVKAGAILFIIFGGFFELLFSTFRPHGLQQYIFPGLLVLLGVYLVITRSGLLSSTRPENDNPSLPLSEEKK